jgi:hypothetical protein
VRKRQGMHGEVIQGRDGLGAVNAVNCIFGFQSDGGEGCSDDAKYRCDSCNALCCNFHKEHILHSDFASQERILKQHNAFLSLDQSKNKNKNLDIGSVPLASTTSIAEDSCKV